MTKEKITEEDIANFRRFLLDAEPCVDQLIEYMDDRGQKLDFTPQSLKLVDDLLKTEIQKIPSEVKRWEELNQLSPELSQKESWLIVRIAYYFAEVLIRNLGAEWNIEKKPRHVYFKKAILKLGGMLNGVEPLGLVLSNGRSEKAKGLYNAYIFIADKNNEFQQRE